MSSDLAGCEPAAISTLDGKPRTQSANGTYHRSAALTGGGLERDSQLVSNLLRALAESEKPQHLKFPRGWLIHSLGQTSQSEQIRSEFERRRTRTSTRRTIRLFLRSSDRRPVTTRWPRVYGDLKQRNHARTPKAWDRFLRFGSSPFSHLTDGMIDEGELSTDATGNGRAGTDGR
jgi:hypothetical protein